MFNTYEIDNKNQARSQRNIYSLNINPDNDKNVRRDKLPIGLAYNEGRYVLNDQLTRKQPRGSTCSFYVFACLLTSCGL